ncbi:MAG: ATP-binding protein [Treponema sp.]|jgi:predicted AAA+ superfamily ATPase|nr:ATP-binding protein [Treponema sp.]
MNPALIKEAKAALADIEGLVLFAKLRDRPLIQAFTALLQALAAQGADKDAQGLIRPWACFMASLVETELPCQEGGLQQGQGDLYHAVAWMSLTDDNLFTRTAELHPITRAIDSFPQGLFSLAGLDLSRLGRIAAFASSRVGFHIGALIREGLPYLDKAAHTLEEEARFLREAEGQGAGAYPLLDTLFPYHSDWSAALADLIAHIQRSGAGSLGLYRAFRWTGLPEAALQPVQSPDQVRLSSLAGYEQQRALVIANTLRFLEGKPANNLLLYGDRGTGKSATVKALCNEYAKQGLRLLEVPKEQLAALPRILEVLRCRGLHFIIFIDDLSFEKTDDSFTGLKMLLEGGIEARPSQVLIYATSNRRHLVKEYAADRPTTAMAANALATGDMRAFDSMQEQFSLADRFGLTVVFTAPVQEEFLYIAEYIARERGVLTGAPQTEAWKTFRENALRWERWFNGRSPRTAVQYVDWLAGGGGFPWESPPAPPKGV